MSKQLADILYKVRILNVHGATNRAVANLCIDSRQVTTNCCFVAIVGVTLNGHTFIDAAIASGATSIVCEVLPPVLYEQITYVQVANSQEALAYLSHYFYDQPSSKIKLVGVTGTNGKTTIATLLYNLFTALGYKCGLLSTVQNVIGTTVLEATHTTPDAISLNKLLKQMHDANCTHVFMECSSHAIHQHRITALDFDGALFSNITHDHLDYHYTFEEYIKVKKYFFDHLKATAFAITNLDDKRGLVMLQNSKAKKYGYSLRDLADFKGKIIENTLLGLVLDVNGTEVHFRLIGEFNAYNLLAVFGAASCLGIAKDAALQTLSNINGAEGRFECLVSPKNKVIGIVDYAHTPDALLNVLATIKKLKQGHEKLITVVGCGGDRDKTKRPIMAQVACEYSDKAILTSDNPRTENPQTILDDMVAGMQSQYKRKSICILDRREAIKAAVDMAMADDIVLIAGKGHEKYQEIKGIKNHFDDKEELVKMFELFDK
jgi:UDP-N-acetylmuramoyl-L-alanyl-D-glutamate--2,6-diaminopimelate ligase